MVKLGVKVSYYEKGICVNVTYDIYEFDESILSDNEKQNLSKTTINFYNDNNFIRINITKNIDIVYEITTDENMYNECDYKTAHAFVRYD